MGKCTSSEGQEGGTQRIQEEAAAARKVQEEAAAKQAQEEAAAKQEEAAAKQAQEEAAAAKQANEEAASRVTLQVHFTSINDTPSLARSLTGRVTLQVHLTDLALGVQHQLIKHEIDASATIQQFKQEVGALHASGSRELTVHS